MEVTGTVASVRRMRTAHGSTFIRAAITRPGTHDIALTWLHGSETVPARGQRVTITGMTMMTRPRKGSYRTNVSIDTITSHDQEDAPS
jgi:hypothetical protein